MAAPSLIMDNGTEREHLRTLANRLSEADLNHPLEAGWTVSAVLAHLAFWDHRSLTLLEKWQIERSLELHQ